MTVDVFPPVLTHTVAGTGPYTVNFGFSDPSHVALRLFTEDGSSELLNGALWSLAPTGSAQTGYTGGMITLTAGAAADLDGMSIRPERFSNLEQGWVADASPRERGLKRQLDWLARAAQENAARLDRAIIARELVQPFSPQAGRALIFNDALLPVPGPKADEIASAQSYSEAAKQSADRVDLGALDAAVQQTGLDRIATGLDVVQTGQDRQAAQTAATNAATNANAQIAPNVQAAENAAGRASVDAERAEAAAGVAFGDAAVKPDIATGLSETSPGDQFQVVADNGRDTIRYRHDAGPVATPLLTLRTAKGVSQSALMALYQSEKFKGPWHSDWPRIMREIERGLRSQAEARLTVSTTTWYVRGDAAPGGNGLSVETAFSTWAAAYSASADGDTIDLGGTFTPAQATVPSGLGVRRRLRIFRNPGTVVDGRAFGSWTDEGGGVKSIAMAANPRAVAYNLRQDDEAGTATGGNWSAATKSSRKYREGRLRWRRALSDVRVWFGFMREAGAATTTPAVGFWSYTGGRLYINAPGAPSLASVNELACWFSGTQGVTWASPMRDCYAYGRLDVIFTPSHVGSQGISVYYLNAQRCTEADVVAHMCGYHAVVFADMSADGNVMLCCTINGMATNVTSGLVNPCVFYTRQATYRDPNFHGHDIFFVAYPLLDDAGAPILKNNYKATLGYSHTDGIQSLAGVPWTGCAQLDFLDQIAKKSGVPKFYATGFIAGNNIGLSDTLVDGSTPWGVTVWGSYALGAGAWMEDRTDHDWTVIDRDNRGVSSENLFVMSESGAASSRRFRFRNGAIAGGACNNWFSNGASGAQILFENSWLVIEQGTIAGIVNSVDPANPLLRLGGCLVEFRTNFSALLSTGIAGVFNAGPTAGMKSLGGNVFVGGVLGQTGPSFPGAATTWRYLEEVVAALDPLGRDVLGAETVQMAYGANLITNGNFDTDLSGWNNDNDHWVWNSGGDGGRASSPNTSQFDWLWQELPTLAEGDLIEVSCLYAIPANAQVRAEFRQADNSVVSNPSAARFANGGNYRPLETTYRMRVDADWGALSFAGISLSFHQVDQVSVRKVTTQWPWVI